MQQTKVFSISGRIQNEHDEGVFGLRVVAYDNDRLFDDRLGAAVTAEDGSFRLQYAEADFRDLFEAKPDVYIEVFDCTGKRVYSSAKTTKWQAGAEAQIDATIPDVKLQEHLEKSRPLARLRGGLVASENLDVIDAAAELLQSRIDQGMAPPLGGMGRPPKFRNMTPLSAAYCPAPDILGFDHVLDTAWGVLLGDPRVRTVFEDILDTVFYRFRVRAPEVAAAASRDWAEDRPLELETLAVLLKTKRETLSPGSTDTLIERDRLLPVIAAAVIAARGDRVLENRNLGTLLGQCGALCQLDKVYRAADGALVSNPHGLSDFAQLLGHVGGTCGPDDGPIPFPPRRDDLVDVNEILFLEMIHCAAEMVQASRSGLLDGGAYEILTANWSDGCPGSPIVLTGKDFEGLLFDRNEVVFTHQDGIRETRVAPATETDWTDTRIEVALPSDAGPGPVSLSIVGNYASVCGEGIEPPRWGNSVEFSGGAAYIRNFYADDRQGEFGVEPAETVILRWLVVPDNADVHLRVDQDGSLVIDEGVAVEGTRDISIPDGRASRTVCTLTTSNHCSGTDDRVITLHGGLAPALAVNGIEVTQAIQYYRADEHLNDPSDWGDDNSLQLVVGKPALVRVYLRSGLPLSYEGGRIAGVTGTLDVERIEDGTPTLLTTLAGFPVSAEASPAYANERGNLRATLNFLVPANHMSGRLRFTVNALTPVGCFHDTCSAETTVDVDLDQTLQVAGIMVGYNGPPVLGAPAGTPNLVLTAPALADLQTTAAWMLAAFPVRSDSVLAFRVAATRTQTVPLTDAIPLSGDCPPNWGTLIGDLQAAATADAGVVGGNWVYYGLLATQTPVDTPGGATGCGARGVGTGLNGNGPTMGHEVGHALGLDHAPCGNPPDVDPKYPAYEPYDPASIGEYGFEFRNGAQSLYHPSTPDFMSYCGPEWMSLYHHDRLLNIALLSPLTLPLGSEASARRSDRYVKHRKSMEPESLINFLAFIDPDNAVQVHSISRLVTRPEVIGGVATELAVQLLSEDDAVIAAAPAWDLPLEGPGHDVVGEKGCRCRRLIQALVPNLARGARLQLCRGKEVLWQRHAPDKPIAVTALRASVGKQGQLRATWDVEVAEGLETRSDLRWSRDGGKSWRLLTMGLVGHGAEIDLTAVPGGEVLFEVVVSDGFESAQAASSAVYVPHKPPTVAILSPTDGAEIPAGGALRLWGGATAETGRPVPDEACKWLVDDQPVDTGHDLIVAAPAPGKRRITFRASDDHGTTEITHQVTVRKRSK